MITEVQFGLYVLIILSKRLSKKCLHIVFEHKIILTLRKLQKNVLFIHSFKLLFTTLLKVERADTTVDKNNYHRKNLNSNLETFHRFKSVTKPNHYQWNHKTFKIK